MHPVKGTKVSLESLNVNVTVNINSDPWDQMARKYIDQQGRVDYASWQQQSWHDLDEWLSTIASVDWRTLPRNAAIAFFLNLYNALTVQQILHRYPIQSIRPTVFGIPNWLAFLRFFTRRVYVLNGEALSLNAIEHDILRPQFQDPRIHFAVVCASVGCPLLRPGAYTPDRVMPQLEDDAHRFINNPDKVRYDRDRHILYCSKIFQWYGKDFLMVADSIPAYISRYLQSDPISRTAAIAYLPYSWDLNQRTSS
jgi:hypothetical protein